MSIKIKRILLTGARAPVTLDLARRFNSSGHLVFVTDSVPYALSRSSNAVVDFFQTIAPEFNTEHYIVELIKHIKHYNIDVLIPTCEEIMYIAQYKNELSRYCQVLCDEFSKLKLLHNKYTFYEFVKSLSIRTPDTIFCNGEDSISELSYPYIIKPCYSRFSAKAGIINSQDEYTHHKNKFSYPFIAQQYIQGELICSYSLCSAGEIISHIAYKCLNTSGKVGVGIHFNCVNSQFIFDVVNKIVKKMNFTGQIALDFIKDKKGYYWLLECNPRTTSGIHLFPQESDLTDAFLHAKPSLWEKNAYVRSKGFKFGVAYYGIKQSKSIRDIIHVFHDFFRLDDILFSTSDLKPFFYQLYCVYKFNRFSIKNKLSLAESMTEGIEWDEKK